MLCSEQMDGERWNASLNGEVLVEVEHSKYLGVANWQGGRSGSGC